MRDDFDPVAYTTHMGALSEREIMRTMGRDCLAFRVRRASRTVTRLYDGHLAAVGLSSTQLTLLSAIGNRPDLKLAQLADVLGVEQSVLSRNAELLRKKRWIARVATDDKRERAFTLTATGKKKVREGWRHWQRAQAELHTKLGANADALLRQLDRLHARA